MLSRIFRYFLLQVNLCMPMAKKERENIDHITVQKKKISRVKSFFSRRFGSSDFFSPSFFEHCLSWKNKKPSH